MARKSNHFSISCGLQLSNIFFLECVKSDNEHLHALTVLWLIIFVQGEAKELCRPQPKKDELKALQIKFTEAAPPENVPKRWRLLYKHAMTIMKETGVSVKIPCDRQVFGCDKKICLLQEELLALLQFNMVGQSAISAYMMLVFFPLFLIRIYMCVYI